MIENDACDQVRGDKLLGTKSSKSGLYEILEKEGTALSLQINMYRIKKRAISGEKDVCVDILLGSRCQFLLTDVRNDKTACFVKLVGFLHASNASEEIAVTDAVQLLSAEPTYIKKSSGITISQNSFSGNVVRLSFSLVVSCDLQIYRYVKAIVYRCFINQNVELSQQCIGAGTGMVKN